MSEDSLGYYKILELTADADEESIKRSYRDLAKIWHPDYNKAPGAVEVFQKISQAYEVLKDENKRLQYDLLSMVYGEDNFPKTEDLVPLRAPENSEDTDIRVIAPKAVRGMLWKYSQTRLIKYCTYRQAVKWELKTAVMNWLLGWWSLPSLFKNAKVLWQNFRKVDLREENLQLFVHNAIAYFKEGRAVLAARSAALAYMYAPENQKELVLRFLTFLNQNISRPKNWNWTGVRVAQLVIPICLIMGSLLWFVSDKIIALDLSYIFQKDKRINYYQEVVFGNRGETVDDVVVGKVLSIPVDRSDVSHLYHLKIKANMMYGPSKEFDVIRVLDEATTVRLTGKTPDEVWARIMIDNGEMGFVRMNLLQKGIGRPIPEFSRIYEVN